MKKTIAILLVLVMCLAFAACGSSQKSDKADVKIGFIFLHDENSTYDKNFMDAAKAACEELKVDYILKTNVDESDACYQAAADLVDQSAVSFVLLSVCKTVQDLLVVDERRCVR